MHRTQVSWHSLLLQPGWIHFNPHMFLGWQQSMFNPDSLIKHVVRTQAIQIQPGFNPGSSTSADKPLEICGCKSSISCLSFSFTFEATTECKLKYFSTKFHLCRNGPDKSMKTRQWSKTQEDDQTMERWKKKGHEDYLKSDGTILMMYAFSYQARLFVLSRLPSLHTLFRFISIF